MRRRVSVTQLVDFAKCEKLGVLKLGRREALSAARRQAIDRGVQAHADFERQTVVDGRCFVASFAFGPRAAETMFLRDHRDRVWKRHATLRFALRCYYWSSPKVVSFLASIPGGRRWARWVVRSYILTLCKGGPRA